MTDTVRQNQAHASDGDLLRLLDGELTPAESQVRAHVAECGACAARLARYRTRSATMAELLRETAPPAIDPARVRPPLDDLSRARARRAARAAPRAAWWTRPGVRAAAAVVVMAGVAAASPARGWLMERLRDVQAAATESAGREPVRPTPSAPAAPAPSAGALVRFDVGGAELVVRFAASQRSGTVEIAGTGDGRAAAQVTGGLRDEALLVLPRELRIRNATSSEASYRVEIPPGVARVRLLVGSGTGTPRVLEVRPGDRHTIALRELR
jgi:hypothetical protein